MSARSAFVPSKAAAQKPSHDTNNELADSATATTTNSTGGAPSLIALRDSSNSFRPTSQLTPDVSLGKSMTTLNKDNAIRPFMGTDKPLNIAALTRSKNKKNGESNTPVPAKKQRLSAVNKSKENNPELTACSPKSRHMSPSRLPRASGLPPSLMFTHQEPNSITSGSFSSPLLQIPEISEHSQTHIVNESSTTFSSFARPSVLSSSNPFDSSIGAPLSSLVSPRPRSGTLDPSRREIFPLRLQQEHVDLTQQRNSLSPPPPAQPYISEEHRDYRVPIETASNDNHPEHDHRLRRATKRLDMLIENETDGFVRKRTKVGGNNEPRDQAVITPLGSFGRPSTPFDAGRFTSPEFDDQNVSSFVNQRDRPPSRVSVHPRTASPQEHLNNSINLHPGGGRQDEIEQEREVSHAALSRFLGIDMERYLAEHIDYYESEKARWADCTVDEWKNGADEMSSKFSKIIDFVKEHMITKVALFADLQKCVVEQFTTLNARDTMLKNTRSRLVKDSGTVIQGGVGETGNSSGGATLGSANDA